jgi:Mrp family chromosome partitioning ATPase
MTRQLKKSTPAPNWKYFWRRAADQKNLSDLSKEYQQAHHEPDYQKLLSRVLEPSAQRVFAGLHNNLIMRAPKDHPGIILVCTANPGEGSSSVALGLAAAAARDKQDKILQIEGNFYHPCLCQAWGLPRKLGFFDLLTGATDSFNLAQQTRLGNLWVLGAGNTMGTQFRDVEPQHLQDILATLTSIYSQIIIDGPPLNMHPESNLYAQYAHFILLIVAAGVSRAPVVNNAIAKFPAHIRDKLEVVLNRRTYPIPEAIYRKLWTS